MGKWTNQRKKLERLCRYITRPAIAEQRLSVASNGNVIVALKTPYDDGTSRVVLGPMEFMGRLAALVPKLAKAGHVSLCGYRKQSWSILLAYVSP